MEADPRSKGGRAISTITDSLRLRACQQPDDLAYALLQDGEVADSLTYARLDEQARAIACQLHAVEATGTALLLYPSGLDFIAAFFGCLYADVTAVPLFPPRRNRSDARFGVIRAACDAKFALTTSIVLQDIERRAELESLHFIATDNTVGTAPAAPLRNPPDNAAAYLQFTSGSTSLPKGVIVTHAGLLSTLTDLDRGLRHSRRSVMVSWLPLFHDMGLIYGIAQPLYGGFPCYLMDPAAFLQRPVRWLEAISRYGGTHSAAPNFAFDLCTRTVREDDKAGLDLHRWQVALNGAEPVRADTLRRFTAAFARCGFTSKAFCPGYGLAESTLKVTAVRRDAEPTVLRLRADGLLRRRVEEADDGTPDARTLVGCGVSEIGARIAIVDPEAQQECGPSQIGEIWVKSASAARGYWGRDIETAETFAAQLSGGSEGSFLRTGDLGFLKNGELFVAGRLKDVIVIRGMNHYPQDIELTVERCHPALRPGCGAAFALEVNGEEQLIIAQEVERTRLRSTDMQEVVRAIRMAVAREHDLAVQAIALLRPASIPKTSSGKVQRRACCDQFQAATLKVVAQWQQAHRVPAGRIGSVQHGGQSGDAIEQWILDWLAERLAVAPSQLDAHTPFAALGLDSLSAVRLSGELEEWLGLRLSPTLAFEYPTPKTLASFLASEPRPIGSRAAAPARRRLREPVAVIGVGCRFPGAPSPPAFWRALVSGADSVAAPPSGRWQGRGPAGRNEEIDAADRPGHFLPAIDLFDAEFFGLAPREAQSMDPQQRLLLEVAWEAMEDAGQVDLAGSATGVFVGISSSDYARLLLSHPDQADAYCGTGGALSIAANRLSYLLDLRGPSWAVDTACSSSLVAVHNACQALRLGECDLAFAGGVNLMVSPELTLALAEARMLSGDGRCKAFDAQADGYGRGEGCGMVLLKRYSDALRDGDDILAVIAGSAVNQDGRSNGLTAPNGVAQQEVIRGALANAGIEPSAISYVEAHGTGTALGDPIEVNALKAVLSEGRSSEQPCWFGSVKTNIGHLEAAAGIAGLIKVVLSLKHRELPAHLHLNRLNPYIELDGTPFAIPTVRQPWPASAQPRTAGVSSFGFGGTNAHVILCEADPAGSTAPGARIASARRPADVLALSAKGPNAWKDLAARYLAYLEAHPDTSVEHLCWSANTRRMHFQHRCSLVTESSEHLRRQLRAILAEETVPGIHFGQAPLSSSRKVVFLFTGQGSQYPGMGQELFETEHQFRQTLEHCDRILRPQLEAPLLDVLYGSSGDLLDQTAYAQPALFAVEYALAALWQSWGIRPAAVLGHSLGEYVAACVAGVFSLEEGLRLVAERGRLMQAAPGRGQMLAVFADEARVNEVIATFPGDLSIAAVNGPGNTVVSGSAEAVTAALERFTARGIPTQRLHTSHAFHSALMEPVIADFARAAEATTYRAPRIMLISNVSGRPAAADVATADYWCRHLREPVRFAAGIEALAAGGHDIYLELGPHPVLAVQGRQCRAEDCDAVWLPSLCRGRSDQQQMCDSLAQLYVRGASVTWRGRYTDRADRPLHLPTYPFQRQRFWLHRADRHDATGPLRDAALPTSIAMLLEQGDAEALARRVAAGLSPQQRADVTSAMQMLVDQHRREAAARTIPDWFYRPAWDSKPRNQQAKLRPRRGAWLILADHGGLGERLRDLLERAGAYCAIRSSASLCRDQGNGAPDHQFHWAAQLDALRAEAARRSAPDFDGIIYLGALDTPSPDGLTADALMASQANGCEALLHLTQHLARQTWTIAPKLWVVTQGAAPAGGPLARPGNGARPAADRMRWQLDQAPVWGLSRVLRLEHPDMWGGFVDLAPDREPSDQAEALLRELLDPQGEDQVAFRGGERLVARLRPMRVAAADGMRSAQTQVPLTGRISPDQTYLISGGLGALGLRVAAWLVEQGARNLVLLGRNTASAAARKQVAELRQTARIVVARSDVSHEFDLVRLFAEMRDSLPPLRGVIHAAGVVDDGILLRQDRRRMAAVMAPKVAGAWNLHRLTRELPLDFFVLFSSATALLGWRGQGTYAAANAFLAALAHHRVCHGLPALCIDWGPWNGIGAAAALDARHSARWQSHGLSSLNPDRAIEALELAMRRANDHVAILAIDWAAFVRGLPAQLPLLADLMPDAPPHDSRPPASSELLSLLLHATSSERRNILISHIQSEAAAILRLAPGQVPDVTRGFFDMGFDSLMALELKGRLNASVGAALPSTLLFQFPSIESVADHLMTLLIPNETGFSSAVPSPDATVAEIAQLSEGELELLVDRELQRSLQ
jgi:acyl transferase domain-containing protein/acyl-CoA synthetase (AMP-forming)/AMP-acid ligase II/acyl carrier protein